MTEPSLPEKKIIFLWCLCFLQNFLFVLCFRLQSAYFCLPRTITLLGRFVNMWCHTGSVYITNRKILNYSQPVDTWTFQGFPGKNHVYQGFSRFLSFLFKVFKNPYLEFRLSQGFSRKWPPWYNPFTLTYITYLYSAAPNWPTILRLYGWGSWNKTLLHTLENTTKISISWEL